MICDSLSAGRKRGRLRKHMLWGLVLVLGALAPAGAVLALDLPAPPTRRINDFTATLDYPVRVDLENRLAEFETATSNQIVVAIFPSLEEENLEDFVNRLFQHWRLGQREKDNGVLLAIFMAERKIRIEVGYGLEGALTDALCARIIRDEIAPEFRRNRHERGIRQAIFAIEQATRGEYVGTPRRSRSRGLSPEASMLFGILIGLLFLTFLWSMFRRQSGSYTIDRRGGRRRSDDGDWWTGMGGGSSGGGFFGGGGGGGGGFSGGGGSSGGGGASGGW